MDMERLSPAPPQPAAAAWHGGGSSSEGDERDRSPDCRRRVIPVEDHLELANAVLNSAGPRINCPVDDDEEGELSPHRTTTTAGTRYESGGRGMSTSTTASIICK